MSVGRVGTQPDRIGGIAHVQLAGQRGHWPVRRLQLEMPLQLGTLAGLDTAALGPPQRLCHVIGQGRGGKTAAGRQQQRCGGHRFSPGTGR